MIINWSYRLPRDDGIEPRRADAQGKLCTSCTVRYLSVMYVINFSIGEQAKFRNAQEAPLPWRVSLHSVCSVSCLRVLGGARNRLDVHTAEGGASKVGSKQRRRLG